MKPLDSLLAPLKAVIERLAVSPSSEPPVEKVKCNECDAMIFPRTAAQNRGLCPQCVQLTPGQLQERREREEELLGESWFRPTAAELASAKSTLDLMAGDGGWHPHPEFYPDEKDAGVEALITQAALEKHGHVVLRSNSGATLTLAFNAEFGVCDYLGESAKEFHYAFTDANLQAEAPEDLELEQMCVSCGVEMEKYPSRFHMPRAFAFRVLRSVAIGADSLQIRWIAFDRLD